MADYEKGSKHSVNKDQHKIISGPAQINQKNMVNDFAGKVGDVITAPIDFIKWFTSNWQLVIIGAVALMVLIRK